MECRTVPDEVKGSDADEWEVLSAQSEETVFVERPEAAPFALSLQDSIHVIEGPNPAAVAAPDAETPSSELPGAGRDSDYDLTTEESSGLAEFSHTPDAQPPAQRTWQPAESPAVGLYVPPLTAGPAESLVPTVAPGPIDEQVSPVSTAVPVPAGTATTTATTIPAVPTVPTVPALPVVDAVPAVPDFMPAAPKVPVATMENETIPVPANGLPMDGSTLLLPANEANPRSTNDFPERSLPALPTTSSPVSQDDSSVRFSDAEFVVPDSSFPRPAPPPDSCVNGLAQEWQEFQGQFCRFFAEIPRIQDVGQEVNLAAGEALRAAHTLSESIAEGFQDLGHDAVRTASDIGGSLAQGFQDLGHGATRAASDVFQVTHALGGAIGEGFQGLGAELQRSFDRLSRHHVPPPHRFDGPFGLPNTQEIDFLMDMGLCDSPEVCRELLAAQPLDQVVDFLLASPASSPIPPASPADPSCTLSSHRSVSTH